MDLYNFNARTYDLQLGRFIQIDLLAEVCQEKFGSNQFGFDNSVVYNDPDGKYLICPLVPLLIELGKGAVAAYVAYKIMDENKEAIDAADSKMVTYLNDRLGT